VKAPGSDANGADDDGSCGRQDEGLAIGPAGRFLLGEAFAGLLLILPGAVFASSQ
jgi:hypothetical protein